MIKVKQINSQKQKAEICDKILRQLPKWFGIESAIIDYIEQVKNMEFFATFSAATPVGFIALLEHNQDTAEVYVMGVLEKHQHQGLGKTLLQACEQFCREEQKSYLSVKTLADTKEDEAYAKTRAFYYAMGFKTLEIFPLLWNKDNPCVFMVKNIAEPQ